MNAHKNVNAPALVNDAGCGTSAPRTPHTTPAGDAALQGAAIVFKLLKALEKVPDVPLQGELDEPGDETFGFNEGAKIIFAAIADAGFVVADHARAAGFAAGLSWYVLPEVNGLTMPDGFDPMEEAAEALVACAVVEGRGVSSHG